jgi:hypothetical protein
MIALCGGSHCGTESDLKMPLGMVSGSVLMGSGAVISQLEDLSSDQSRYAKKATRTQQH